ncbi:MAG: uroporphyrinogen decarboxylase family protein [Planctomycetota bacterium]|jgi:uroporphyrinogen decarboxylase
MKRRERVFAALRNQEPDRVPRFEIWIDGLFNELGNGDPQRAYVDTGQDCIMIPSQTPAESNAWRDGVDEWGRIWKNGIYAGGAVADRTDLDTYNAPLDYAEKFFDTENVERVKDAYPDHCLIFGTHIGPFTAGYMAMGFERFFTRFTDDPLFIHTLLESRTEWCIALYQRAVELGAEVLILADDAAHNEGPMISPEMWREFVLPLHRRIVDRFDVPVIWHSDGYIEGLLPMAIDAGFAGVHGLEPSAGMDLASIKRRFGSDLALIGNIDIKILCNSDLQAVRTEVARCLDQGAPGGGYMVSTCNSIFQGMNPEAVAEMFRSIEEIMQ